MITVFVPVTTTTLSFRPVKSSSLIKNSVIIYEISRRGAFPCKCCAQCGRSWRDMILGLRNMVIAADKNGSWRKESSKDAHVLYKISPKFVGVLPSTSI